MKINQFAFFQYGIEPTRHIYLIEVEKPFIPYQTRKEILHIQAFFQEKLVVGHDWIVDTNFLKYTHEVMSFDNKVMPILGVELINLIHGNVFIEILSQCDYRALTRNNFIKVLES